MTRSIEFNVAGVTHHVRNIEQLMTEPNEEYGRPNKELIEDYQEGDRIYKMEADILTPVELIPEPDNKYDPNAIKVVAGGRHIGYIKKTDTSKVNELLELPDLKGTKLVQISYGDVKLIAEDEDKPGKLTVKKTVFDTPSVTIAITVNQSDTDPTPDTPPAPNTPKALETPKKKSKALSVILLILGIVFALFGLLIMAGGSPKDGAFVLVVGLVLVLVSILKK